MIRMEWLSALLVVMATPALADESCRTTPIHAVAATHTLPPYPSLSVQAEEQGTTLLLVHITPDGTADDVRVDISSGSPRLDEAARAHVLANWRWQPLVKGCGDTGIVTRISIKWDIKQAPSDIPPLPVILAVPADWPAQALARHEQGTAIVFLLLRADGTLFDTQVPTSSGYADLDDKSVTLALARQWTPSRMDGTPVMTVIQVMVKWQIAPPPNP